MSIPLKRRAHALTCISRLFAAFHQSLSVVMLASFNPLPGMIWTILRVISWGPRYPGRFQIGENGFAISGRKLKTLSYSVIRQTHMVLFIDMILMIPNWKICSCSPGIWERPTVAWLPPRGGRAMYGNRRRYPNLLRLPHLLGHSCMIEVERTRQPPLEWAADGETRHG